MVPSKFLIYGIFILLLLCIAYLLKKEMFLRPLRLSLLVITTVSGFFFIVPMVPVGFQAVVLHVDLSLPRLTLVIFSFLLIIALTFLFGRIFCGYCCPFGTLQELFYLVKVPKLVFKQKRLILMIRNLVMLALIIVGYIFSVNLFLTGNILLHGAMNFYKGDFRSILTFLFLLLLVISLFLYRPLCRFVCPYGAILSLTATRSVYSLRFGSDSTKVAQSAGVCPTGEPGDERGGNECYFCGRCLDISGSGGPVRYRKREGKFLKRLGKKL